MIYKVLIPTAGIGSRLLKETENINKALVLINNKPIISHIIEKFPINIEFVIALGYKGDLVKQYLKIAHPKNKFKFIPTKVRKFSYTKIEKSIEEIIKYLKWKL